MRLMACRRAISILLLMLCWESLAACDARPSDGVMGTASTVCTSTQAEIKNALEQMPILDQAPSATTSNGKGSGCLDEPSDVQADHQFRTHASPVAVQQFYMDAVRAGGWRLLKVIDPPSEDLPPDQSGQDLMCATRMLDGKAVYLEVWYPDADSGLIKDGDPGSVYEVTLSLRPRNSGTCL